MDSTRLNEEIGDRAMRSLWQAHDSAARRLLRDWRGREIGRSDGFLLLFDSADDAVGFAMSYHGTLAAIDARIQVRVGVHVGPVRLRKNSPAEVAQGATPFEVDGVALPVAARIMSAASGGQTLLSSAALNGCSHTNFQARSQGHWRLKGLTEPIELFEVVEPGKPFTAPAESAKAYRVIDSHGTWIPARELPRSLPVERDEFCDRTDALSAIRAWFDHGARLVTVTGIGGMGKTRLALHYANHWIGDFPGGAWFCDLSAARDMDGIIRAVAQGLEVPLGQANPIQQLAAAMAGRGSCLVVFDNFEQVARHAEETLGTWLAHAPMARFIVASREVLGIAGEHALLLDPLPPSDAKRLFELRVAAAGVPHDGQEDDAAVAPLVDLLDRLPLAIELAAARARIMSPGTLLRRMGERFKLLSARGGRVDRQLTLQATLDWSWDLLSPAEQSTLVQLSVFQGGFTLDAAEAVVEPTTKDRGPCVADAVQALVEKSLVRQVSARRFDMLRTVQDYAAQRMSPAEEAGARRRHLGYFARLEESEATAQRCIELRNLVAACEGATGADPEHVAGALSNAWAALRLAGPFQLAVDLAQRLDARLPETGRPRAIVDFVLGAGLSLLGRSEPARERFASSVRHARACGDRRLVARVLCSRAALDVNTGCLEAAADALAEAVQISREQRDETSLCRALNGLGEVHMIRSDRDRARACYLEALRVAERQGDLRQQGGLHGNLGTIAHAEGRLEEARGHYTTGLSLAKQVGDRQWEGNAHCNLGLLLHEMGDDERAVRELRSAVEQARSIGHRRLEATSFCNLGIAAEAASDLRSAMESYERGIAIAREMGDRRLEGQTLGYLGSLLSRTGCHDRALEHLRHAEDLLSRANDPISLGLVLCQHAVAAWHSGAAERARELLARAEAVVTPLNPPPGSEIAQAIASTRNHLAPR